MMKLYAFSGACSLGPHIVLNELNLPFELVMLKMNGTPELWSELEKINPMGQVPTLVTDKNEVLTEGPAIYQYLASKKEGKVFPTAGWEHFRALEWLNFISTTLHKGFNPLFSPENHTTEPDHESSVRKKGHENLKHFVYVAEIRFSEKGPFAMGEKFTVVDAYLFNVLSWSKYVKFDLSVYPKLSAFMKKMIELPSVIEAMKKEGIYPKNS